MQNNVTPAELGCERSVPRRHALRLVAVDESGEGFDPRRPFLALAIPADPSIQTEPVQGSLLAHTEEGER